MNIPCWSTRRLPEPCAPPARDSPGPQGYEANRIFALSAQGFTTKQGAKPEVLACSQLIVRRLNPTEAERLQGCPDNWTKYGADGKTISDTKRYSMLGNGIAAPCAAYIMQGIRQAIERSD